MALGLIDPGHLAAQLAREVQHHHIRLLGEELLGSEIESLRPRRDGGRAWPATDVKETIDRFLLVG